MGMLGFTIPDSNKGSKFGVAEKNYKKNDRRKHHSCPYSVVYYGEV